MPSVTQNPTASSKSWPGVRIVTVTGGCASWSAPRTRISIGSSVTSRSGRSWARVPSTAVIRLAVVGRHVVGGVRTVGSVTAMRVTRHGPYDFRPRQVPSTARCGERCPSVRSIPMEENDRGVTMQRPRTDHGRLPRARPRPRPRPGHRWLGARHRRAGRTRPRVPSSRSFPPSHPSTPSPGDIADESHRRALLDTVDALGGGLDSARPQRRACSAPARSPRWRSTRSTSWSASTRANVFAPLRLTQMLLPQLGPDGARHLHHVRRRRRAVRGLGRLRVVEGGARAVDEGACRRTAGAARLRGRPRRHAHADAPGRVPRRGHHRSASARGRASPGCWRSSRAITRAAATSAGARARKRVDGSGVMSAIAAPDAFDVPDDLVADSPAEARGLAHDEVRLLVASKATGRLVDTTFRRSSRLRRRR